MRCWCGYLSAMRCRLFAYGPADATAIPKAHHAFLIDIQNVFTSYLNGIVLPVTETAVMLGLGPGHKILALALPLEVSAFNAAALWVKSYLHTMARNK